MGTFDHFTHGRENDSASKNRMENIVCGSPCPMAHLTPPYPMDLAKLKQTYLVLNCDVWMKVEFNEYPWATMIHPGHGKTAPSWGSESW